MTKVVRYHSFPVCWKEKFGTLGMAGRYFFPHRYHVLPKCGPDGWFLAKAMLGRTVKKPDQLWELILYALPPALEGFPEDLFFNDEIIWHQQHLGWPGQIATANLVAVGLDLYATNLLSDLVQRRSRNEKLKSKIRHRFQGWPYLLINSVADFASKNGFKNLYIPNADFVIRHTDNNRKVHRQLFERVYDRAPNRFLKVQKQGSWWKLNIADNDHLIIHGENQSRVSPDQKIICICHDIERGIGHIQSDLKLASYAEKNAGTFLTKMLEVEKSMKVTATYNVVGKILSEVRAEIEKDGHCLSFHSYDHYVGKIWRRLKRFPGLNRRLLELAGRNGEKLMREKQIFQCRQVDYRLKGYRPPQSALTFELNDVNLCHHNFEWLASYFPGKSHPVPKLENRLVKIPIQYDDYPLYIRGMEYKVWEEKVLNMARKNDFLAIGLHDCYAQYWLPNYRELLEKLQQFGRMCTLDEVANEVYLTNGC